VPTHPGGGGGGAAVYLAGGGVESINPTPAMLANNDFYLGGYGFGDGKAFNKIAIPGADVLVDQRYATGILGDGVHSRAFAVSDSKHTIVLSQIETQGYFLVYKQGPFGTMEIREDASAAIAKLAKGIKHAPPVPATSEILVDSNHSHGGPDTAGVWGGVPTSYLKLVHDQTVKAIVDSWQHLHKATLTFGVAHGGVQDAESLWPPSGGSDPILTNQFRTDPNNTMMDDEVRVLQARDPDTGTVLDTYVNYSSHPTVLGSSNRLVTGDYTGRLNLQMEQAFGGFAMQQVATLGREQPARDSCPTPGSDQTQNSLCALDSYASRVVTKVKLALANAAPLTGKPIVAMNSYFMTEPATSPVLAGLIYVGPAIGVPAARAGNPPWYTANVIGTTYFVGRIGDVLMTGGPGEMYAQIWDKVRTTVTGMRGYMNIGTAGDFLGYIISPLEAYPEPIRRSMLSGDPPPKGDPACAVGGVSVGCPDPISNDNYFFNVGHDFGERLTCDFLRGAGDILTGSPTTYWTKYVRCPLFLTDLALPPGFDTTFPQQPDLSAVMPHM
jgi:hypothetical protein